MSKEWMLRNLLAGTAAVGLIGSGTTPAWAQSSPDAALQVDKATHVEGQGEEGDIVVTARRFTERLQDVPDAVTVFTTEKIEQAGVQSIGDFANMTPNFTYSDQSSFSAGGSVISMRAIGNGQQGWPSVSILVDGVPIDSLDALGDGTLTDIAQIEILRGPQSAIYGFNAIAGAINITTKAPTNDLGGLARVQYATGDDRSLLGVVSGPIVADKVLFRLTGFKRDRDGLITDPSNGREVDPIDQTLLKGRLVIQPTEALNLELVGKYNDITTGASYQNKLTSLDQEEDFSTALNPRRRLLGRQDHEVYNVSLRVGYDMDFAELSSISAYTKTKQTIESSVCYDNPDDPQVTATFVLDEQGNPIPAPPGVPSCFAPIPVFGSAALPGQAVDLLFDAADNYRTFFQDLRLQSQHSGDLRWVVGFNYLQRQALNGFDVGPILAPAAGGGGCATGFGFDPSKCGPVIILFPTWNERKDRWWGLYGQIAYDITPKLELTLAGRYDAQKYTNTQYTDRRRQTIIPVVDPNGLPLDTQKESKKRFQPKVQLAYSPNDDVMAYFTFSQGFRAGYFNTGQFVQPESTDNYEIGLKSSFRIGGMRAIVNADVFRIDYSNQQFSTVIFSPPFRIAETIPETRINGAELEATLSPSRSLSFTSSVGYLDAQVADGGGRSPYTPRWTANMSADWSHPINDRVTVFAHADWRYNGPLYRARNNLFPNPARNYVNLRGGVTIGALTLTGFIKNLTDERDAPFPPLAFANGGFGRSLDSNPRTAGVQLSLEF